jgi:hypothetical protein
MEIVSIQTEPAQLAEWTALADFLEEMARKQSAADFDRSLADWEAGLRRFNDAELYHAGHCEIEEMDLPTHLRCVRALMGMGEQLVVWSKELDTPMALQKQIAAGVYIVRISHDSFHHGRPEEELERIRRAIFGAEA